MWNRNSMRKISRLSRPQAFAAGLKMENLRGEEYMKSIRYASLLLMGLLASLTLGLEARADVLFPNGDISTSTSGWTSSQDTGSSFLTPLEAITDTVNSMTATVLHFKYDLNTGNWVNIQSPAYAATMNMAAQGNAVSFFYKGDGLQNQLKMEVQDTAGHDYASVTISSKTSGWVQVTLPLTSFTWLYGGNQLNPFTWDNVSKIGFTVTPGLGGTGSVTIDQVVSKTITNVTQPAELVVDEFATVVPPLNDLNSSRNNGYPSSASNSDFHNTTVTASTIAPYSGSTCYLITTPSTGIFDVLDHNNSTGSPLNVTPYTHLSFYVQAGSTIDFDVTAELKDLANPGAQVKIKDYIDGKIIPVGTWKQVLIPLTAFANNPVHLDNLGQFSILIPDTAPNYKLYVDRVSFQALTYTTQPDVKIDSMDTYYLTSSWKVNPATGTQLALSTVDGLFGNAMKMQYSFSDPNQVSGQYVNMNRSMGLNVKTDDANAFQFWYKGTGGNNTIEFKIIDNNQTTFEFKDQKVSNTNNQWKLLTVPYSDFSYFSGSDQIMDFTNLTQMAIALSKGDGGQGDFYLHQVSFTKQAAFQASLPADALINSFQIDNNPFAPQTNSAKSLATFSFVLTDTATVNIKIYDLAGNTVFKTDSVAGPRGPWRFTWDGKDQNHTLVRNGLYLYMVTAESKKTTQRVKNIIGVVR
jgi:hypothetical protein